jgi:hypothetical protein
MQEDKRPISTDPYSIFENDKYRQPEPFFPDWKKADADKKAELKNKHELKIENIKNKSFEDYMNIKIIS